MKRVLIFAMMLSLSGCYARSHFESNLESWKGRTTSDLFDEWGPPTETFDLPNGRKMYTWSDTRGASAVAVGHSIYGVPIGCKITFTVDTHGQVRDWRYQGNNCY